MIGFFIAMLSGALMSVQGVFNTKLTESTSLWVANAFVQFTAFLLCIAAWLVTDRSSMRSQSQALLYSNGIDQQREM